MKKLIAVFGPGTVKPGSALFAAAEELGTLLATAGFNIVTGGYAGVMEAASKGARGAGGGVLGVTAEVFAAKGREPNEYLTREIRVRSAHDRLMELIDLPDAWIAIGNSTGTLVEVTTAWDAMAKDFLERRPLLLLRPEWQGFFEYVRTQEPFAPLLEYLAICESPALAAAQLTDRFGKEPPVPELTIVQ